MRSSNSSRWAVIALCLAAGCSPERTERLEWTVMGTVAAVQTRGADATVEARRARDAVAARFAALERLLNAHDSASELSRLAPLPEDEILARCDPSVRDCYEAAFAFARASGGAFDPRWRGPGTLDLGAIAKGYAVDLAAGDAARVTAGDVLVDLGGNLKSVRGEWRVGVAGTDRLVVLTNAMACATSAEYYRGKHIFDGRTGCAVSNGVASVTVVHPTRAMMADALSTVLFIYGRDWYDVAEDILRLQGTVPPQVIMTFEPTREVSR